MPEPTEPPPDLCLHRSEARREDGRYLIYYTVTPAAADEASDPPSPNLGEGPGGGV
jgi:hypothetical protein